jgi:Cys-rich protein (TIGR01571 family)
MAAPEIITVQPGKYHMDLLESLSDFEACFTVYLLGFCTTGVIDGHLQGTNWACETCLMTTCCAPCTIYQVRKRVQRRRDIVENDLDTLCLTLWCTFCTLTQDLHESRIIRQMDVQAQLTDLSPK